MAEDDMSEEEQEQLKELMGQGDYGYPKPPSKDTQYKFFREILKLENSTKVSNYTNREIGLPRLPVRAYYDIALYADAEDLPKVAAYLRGRAEVINSTSMGRKGWLGQLFVTQIKKEQKVKTSEDVQKKGWFAKKEPSDAELAGG